MAPHRALDIAVRFLLLETIPLVAMGLAFGDAQLDLGLAR
jgi:hypothetical protein